MKIGILDMVKLRVNIEVEGEFDPLGKNQGRVVTECSSPGIDLALKLSGDHEVLFFTPFYLRDFVEKALKTHNINTDFKGQGYDVSVNFEGPGTDKAGVRMVDSYGYTIEEIEREESRIFEGMDAMVITDILECEEVVELSRKHGITVFWLAKHPNDIYYEADLWNLVSSGVWIVSQENALAVLTKWSHLTAEEKKMKQEYQELVYRWENLTDEDPDNVDFETLKKLIYDTYQYYKNSIADKDSVLRQNLLPYKYAAQMKYNLYWMHCGPEAQAYSAALEGLCYVVEERFDAGYEKNPLPMGLLTRTPAGCADPEMDMTSFETFEKSIEDEIRINRKEYGEG